MSNQPAVEVWTDLRDKAVKAFEQFPPAGDEVSLIDAFQRSPLAVRRAYEHTLEQWQAGRVRAPWRIWSMECARSRGNVSVPTGPGREDAVRHAEQRIHTELCHYDRWPEVHDELFGDRGSLRAWPDLEDHMRFAWERERSRGETTNREVDGRARAFVVHRARLAEAVAERRRTLEAEAPTA